MMLTSRLGLDRFPYIHTSDFEVAVTAFQRVLGAHSIDATGGARRFEWRANFVDLGPVAFMSSGSRGGLLLRGVPFTYMLNLSEGGQAEAVTPEGRAEITRGRSAVLFSPTGPISWSYPHESMASTTVRIDPGFVASELEALTGRPRRATVAFAPEVRTDQGPGASLERMCAFLLSELERGADALAHPLVTSNLCQALVRQLLFGQPHDHTHLLERPPPPSSRSVVRFVEEYLEAHAAEPVRVADLAALTGASLRSIEAAFRAQRGTTLGAFLRDKRLELARRRLLGPEPGATVTHAAYASGFLRRGRFDALYLAKFGETPGETRRRGLVAVEKHPSPGGGEDRDTLATRAAALSLRERQVCEAVAEGMLNKQIAAELGISEKTVKSHRARAMARLGVSSTAELTRVVDRLKVERS